MCQDLSTSIQALLYVQVLASGGLSYPHLGTDGSGHKIMTQLGHALHPMYPALTPLKGTHPGGQQLAGTSAHFSFVRQLRHKALWQSVLPASSPVQT